MKTNIISYWRDKKKDYHYLGQKATIVSFTKINNPPDDFGRLPYYSAIIKTADGTKKTGQLVIEGVEPKVGGRVEAVVRIINHGGKKDIIQYGLKFKVL